MPVPHIELDHGHGFQVPLQVLERYVVERLEKKKIRKKRKRERGGEEREEREWIKKRG